MYKFKDDQHKEFYEKHINKTNSQKDPYRKALFYTLGLTEQTQKHVNSLYNFEEDCIDWDGLKEPWQTGTSVRVCRLAFNLYNGLHGEQDEKEKAVNYTPQEIFDCGLIEYMFEAVRVRFEEYKDVPY